MSTFAPGINDDKGDYLDETQLLNQTPSWTIQTYSSQDYSTAIKIRNLWIGASGITMNLIALALLLATKNIKLALKISLLSLISNDLMFLSTMVVNCHFKTLPVTTRHPGCWPVLLVVFTSILISYLSVCQLALQNCVAVFYPLRCHQLVTPSKVTASSLGIWTLSFLLGIGCVGVKFSEDLPCIAFIPLSSSGMAAYASVCIFCAAAVSVINLKIFHKIWSVRRTVAVAPGRCQTILSLLNASKELPEGKVQKTSSLNPNTAVNVASRDIDNTSYNSKWTTAKSLTGLSKVSSDKRGSVWSTHDEPIPLPKRNSGCSCPLGQTSQPIVHQSTVHSRSLSTASESTSTANGYNDSSPVSLYPGVHGNGIELKIKPPDLDNSNLKRNYFIVQNRNSAAGLNEINTGSVKGKAIGVRLLEESKRSRLNDSSLSDFTSTSSSSSRFKIAMTSGNVTCHQESTMRRHGQVRVRNTLLILTFWSCLVTLPFLVSIVLLITCEKAVRIEFAQSSIGIVLSSLVALNAGTNPIFYAWRFLPWKSLYTKFRSTVVPRLC